MSVAKSRTVLTDIKAGVLSRRARECHYGFSFPFWDFILLDLFAVSTYFFNMLEI